MTPLALSPAQIAALEADTLKLIVVPLDPQPDPQYVSFGVEPNALVCWSADGEDVDLIPLPYSIGDRIETPHGNLIVTDVQVKRVQDVTRDEARLTGIYNGPYAVRPDLSFRDQVFITQHGPDAWDNNVWCAFVRVRKEQNDE